MVPVNPGDNIIRRKSIDSNVAIPHDQTFRNIDRARPEPGTPDEYNFNFCGYVKFNFCFFYLFFL